VDARSDCCAIADGAEDSVTATLRDCVRRLKDQAASRSPFGGNDDGYIAWVAELSAELDAVIARRSTSREVL
jgi:hypothetical protein